MLQYCTMTLLLYCIRCLSDYLYYLYCTCLTICIVKGPAWLLVDLWCPGTCLTTCTIQDLSDYLYCLDTCLTTCTFIVQVPVWLPLCTVQVPVWLRQHDYEELLRGQHGDYRDFSRLRLLFTTFILYSLYRYEYSMKLLCKSVLLYNEKLQILLILLPGDSHLLISDG